MSNLNEEIKKRVDIIDFIGQYVKLKKTGRNFKGLCPFHQEKTPSFVVSPDRQIWHCFGTCGDGGDAIKFLMKWENITYLEALKEFAEKLGIPFEGGDVQDSNIKQRERMFQANRVAANFYSYMLFESAYGQRVREYLKSRGIREEIAKKFELGYAPSSWDSLTRFMNHKKYPDQELIDVGLSLRSERKTVYDRFRGRLMFPLKDTRGNIVGFSGRILDSKEKSAKYVNTPETLIYHKRETLYGLHLAKESIRKEKSIILVEGEFDMITPYQYGIENIVAIKGAAVTKEQLMLIKRYTNRVYLMLDADEAGEEAIKRGIEEAENMSTRFLISSFRLLMWLYCTKKPLFFFFCTFMIKIDMFYLYLGKNQIKLLAAKKSLFSQYSIGTHEKKFQVDLLKNGKPANMDVIASAIKEVVQHIAGIKDKQVFLVLPEETFGFIRFDVPGNIAPSAIDSFIKDKLKTEFPQETNGLFYDYFCMESETQKTVSLFTIDMETASKLQEILRLLDLELVTIVPQSLAYFKVFEKTLRKGKVENILYAKYEKDQLDIMLYDSFGLIEGKEEVHKLGGSKTAEQVLKQKSTELEKKGKKINRLILSGSNSETVRQDTFTKDVGMWTNPLKRIIPQFYQEYLKMLITPDSKPFSLLEYDVCFGAFIFSLENRNFSPMKKKYLVNVFARESFKEQRTSSITAVPPVASKRRRGIPKEIFLFVASFVISFGLFSIFSKANLHIPLPSVIKKAQPTAVPTVALPSPTPTPSITRADLKIKILNGSGTAGKASEVKDILKDKDYQEIVTGNADNFDYTQTEVAIKKNKADARIYIIEDLKDYIGNAKITTLSDTETADAVITIGSDFK